MDEVLEKMGSAALDPEANKSEFEDLYKNWGKLRTQKERRQEILSKQKTCRHMRADGNRGILELVNAVEDNNNIYKAKNALYRSNIYVAGFTKPKLSYENVLMLSEWLIGKPDDLMENWYVAPCPKGSRMLVVASHGITKCYNKYGKFRFQTLSQLPGGNPTSYMNKSTCCVLDCFYCKKNNTFYVLDFLAWNNQPMTDCEFDFRNYWLQSQFSDLTQLLSVSKLNKIKFELLPKIPCSASRISALMRKYPMFNNGPDLDGLLFFHKKGHYVAGETPLVGWLFGYMVPEVLGEDITIHELYMDEKPKDYVDQADFIKIFECEQALKKEVNSSEMVHSSEMVQSSEMDTSSAPTAKEEPEE